MQSTLLFIFGTRPEAIKLAPLIKEVQKHRQFDVKICVTAQHRQMLDQVMQFFELTADFDLNIMKPDQTLFDVTSKGLLALENVLETTKPEMVFVQGDTTTSFIGALASYYKKIKVAHIEAGLRSGNKYSPFPEEMNRILTGHLADIHFTPTEKADENLNNENISDGIYCVGNTVIDALFLGLEILKKKNFKSRFESIINKKRFVLITGHRRESFGKGFENICDAICEIANEFKEVTFIYPVHLNPNVQEPVQRKLKGYSNILLTEPLEYPELISLMNRCEIVLTDSGGIQEEAPSLGKPVLVMRDVTERIEGIKAGTALLVGTDKEVIVREMKKLLTDKVHYEKMAKSVNPYGDGTACKQIADIVKKLLNKELKEV